MVSRGLYDQGQPGCSAFCSTEDIVGLYNYFSVVFLKANVKSVPIPREHNKGGKKTSLHNSYQSMIFSKDRGIVEYRQCQNSSSSRSLCNNSSLISTY